MAFFALSAGFFTGVAPISPLARQPPSGGGEPLFRPRHRGLRSRRLFHRSLAVRARRLSRPPASGAVWRFRNEESRLFVAHPEIYGPQFGGYDPVDLDAA
jgi:hypothetical protein